MSIKSNGEGYTATATFTPAAAAYAAGDSIATAQRLLFKDRNGAPFNGGIITLMSATLQVAHTALIAGEVNYYLALYNVTPPSALADNAVWDVPAGDRASFLARLDLGTPVDVGSTLQVITVDFDLPLFLPKTGDLYAYLITVGAFTATAAARKVTLLGAAL